MLSVRNLSFQYRKGENAIRNISFDLPTGFTLLIGENGSGKTTLIRNIEGGLKAQTGAVSIDGAQQNDSVFYRKLSYLPQEFSIYPSLKNREILQFIATQKGVAKDALVESVSLAAKQANITQFLDRKFKQCSLGMQKRIGIAAALLGDPAVVILDEPTAGIDPKERLSFYHVVRECFKEKSVLLSTHILDDMNHLADNVLMLKSGEVVYQGTYIDFCHALDGRLFESISPNRDSPNLPSDAVVITEESTQGGTAYRFLSKETGNSADLKYKNVDPTTEDIWNYYSQNHGAD